MHQIGCSGAATAYARGADQHGPNPIAARTTRPSPLTASVPTKWSCRRWGELAAGIAQAIILGRAIPDPELEDLGFARLDAGLASGAAVGRWAGLYQYWSPVDVGDLLRLDRYSSAAIRSEFARYFPADRSAQC